MDAGGVVRRHPAIEAEDRQRLNHDLFDKGAILLSMDDIHRAHARPPQLSNVPILAALPD
jgi:hypothetical protein